MSLFSFSLHTFLSFPSFFFFFFLPPLLPIFSFQVELYHKGALLPAMALLSATLRSSSCDLQCVLGTESGVLSDRVLFGVPRAAGPIKAGKASSSDGSTVSHHPGEINLPVLMDHLLKEGRLTRTQAMHILEEAAETLAAEPSLIEISGNVTIVGSVMGQFYDLQEVFEKGGSYLTTQYLFLGGMVNRGRQDCSFLLFCVKIKTKQNQKPFFFFFFFWSVQFNFSFHLN